MGGAQYDEVGDGALDVPPPRPTLRLRTRGLRPTAVEEMTSGTFDLTLFTCTYGGRSRITVYCDRLR